MRVPRLSLLLLTATCCLSGCSAFNGAISSQHARVPPKGGAIQRGDVIQKGVHQKGVHQKGVAHQKGAHQKGVQQKSGIHHKLWHRFEPSACQGGWDPVLGSCQACGVCGGACQGHTPAQHLKHNLTCASGCGEIYWGEWISDPPSCDSCDNWGNWVEPTKGGKSKGGRASHLNRLASGWGNLFGHRNNIGKGSGGCNSCGGKGGCDTCGSLPIDDTAGDYDDVEVVPTPEIDASYQSELLPGTFSGFSIRSARHTR